MRHDFRQDRREGRDSPQPEPASVVSVPEKSQARVSRFDRVTRIAMQVVGVLATTAGLILSAPGMPFLYAGRWLVAKGEGK
jgi:hypothetical protein